MPQSFGTGAGWVDDLNTSQAGICSKDALGAGGLAAVLSVNTLVSLYSF